MLRPSNPTASSVTPRAYYSTVFPQPAPAIWEIIRDFNNYPVWVGGAGDSRIEDGKSGDTVGAVRSVLYRGRHIRQRLLALSNAERAQTYEFCGELSLPVGVSGHLAYYPGGRLTPVVNGDRSFVEWWADFDCEPARRDELTGTLRGWFAQWLESLRGELDAAEFPVKPQVLTNSGHVGPLFAGLGRDIG